MTREPNQHVVWAVTVAVVAAMFLLLENPYWVPGGDSEVYVGTAVNLVKGNGNLFNGQAMRIAPPGWPWVLAAVIKFISPTFLALKLVTLTCMVAGLAVYFHVLCRFAPAKVAAALIVLTALISHVYSLTFWLHSDALFVLITALTLLLALQIAEGRRGNWRIAALLGLVIAGALVRWASILNVAIICGALGQGQLKPQVNRVFVTAFLVFTVAIGSLFAVRWGVTAMSPEQVQFEDTAMVDPSAVQNDLQLLGADSKDSAAPGFLTGTAGHSGYAVRAFGYGTWFSYLLWQPFRLATGIQAIYLMATLVGWVVAAMLISAAIDGALVRQWLPLSVVLYTMALCLNWPHATARYLVPISPLILLFVVHGLRVLEDSAGEKRWLRRSWRAVGVVGLISVVLCNAALYFAEVRVHRSRSFYDVYEAGLNKNLIAAALYLNEKHAGNWQTCVNPEYKNINKRRFSPTGTRMLTMLTGKAALQLPRQFIDGKKLPVDRDFRKRFIAKAKVRYYLDQPPISPWRVSHYRMGWLQEWLTKQPVEDSGAGWRLYVCNGAEIPVQIPIPELTRDRYPTRIPGF